MFLFLLIRYHGKLSTALNKISCLYGTSEPFSFKNSFIKKSVAHLQTASVKQAISK